MLYLRLFRPNKVTRWLVYGGISVCGSFYFASIVSESVLCLPRAGQTDTTWLLHFNQCAVPSRHLAVCQGVFGTLSDIYLLVIPIRSIFQLHLPLDRKIGVSAVFMIGVMWVQCVLWDYVPYLTMLLAAPLHALLAVLDIASSSSLPMTTLGMVFRCTFSGGFTQKRRCNYSSDTLQRRRIERRYNMQLPAYTSGTPPRPRTPQNPGAVFAILLISI